MKRGFLLSLLLLLSAEPVLAGSATYTFEGSHPGQLDTPGYNPVNPQTNGGITATFGSGFSFSRTLPNDDLRSCPVPRDFPSYTVGPTGLNTGYFRNAPSGEWAIRYSHDWSEFDVPARSITFSQPIKYFGCWVASVTHASGWACSPYVAIFLGSGHEPNTHFQAENSPGGVSPSGPGQVTPHIEMWSSFNHVTASAYPQQFDSWSGCDEEYPDGEPYHWTYENGALCQWQWVEMVSPTPVSTVYMRWDGNFWFPTFLDNITVSTGDCPNPPCNFEMAQRARDERHYPEIGMDGPSLQNPVVPDLTAEFTNRVTGSVTRMNNKQDAIAPTIHQTWGRLHLIYR